MDYDEVAFYTVEYLAKQYPERLKERYNLDELPDNDVELMEAIARSRGCLQAGGRVNIYKASEILLHELRSGTLGQLTLELPDMIPAELEAVEVAAALKIEQQIKKKEERRKRYLKNKR